MKQLNVEFHGDIKKSEFSCANLLATTWNSNIAVRMDNYLWGRMFNRHHFGSVWGEGLLEIREYGETTNK